MLKIDRTQSGATGLVVEEDEKEYQQNEVKGERERGGEGEREGEGGREGGRRREGGREKEGGRERGREGGRMG